MTAAATAVSADQEARRSHSMDWGNLTRSSLRGRKWSLGNRGETRCRATCLVAKCPEGPVAANIPVRRAAERYRSSSVPRSLWVVRCFNAAMIAVDWDALADEARCFDPTSLGARSSTPQRVNRLRGTMGQAHSGHGAMFIRRAAAHESSRVLDSPGSCTRNTEAPLGSLWRRRCDTSNPAPLSILRVPLPQRESPIYDFNELLSAKSQTSGKARQIESSQGTPAPSA